MTRSISREAASGRALRGLGWALLLPMFLGAACTGAGATAPADAGTGAAPTPKATPASREQPTPSGEVETAILAGGCFWGMEEILRGVPGVLDTDVGYAGGTTPFPTYDQVRTGKTGHAESIRVKFDPGVLSYAELLENWFFRMHDPTTVNRQGNDVGTQYRSAVYWTVPEQEAAVRQTAKVYGEVLAAKGYDPITTELKPADAVGPFYYAEDYHQQYLSAAKNPNGYRCHATTGVPYPAAA